MELLETQDYLLLIDEEAKSKEFDYYLDSTNSLQRRGSNKYGQGFDDVEKMIYCNHIHRNDKVIIAYYPLTKEVKELDLPLLPVTPKDKWGVHETHCCEKCGCKYGDNDCCVAIGIAKAKYSCEYCDDDENDRQFTLEDMKIAFHKGRLYQGREGDTTFESFIQSLSTHQLPKEFIPEYKKVHKKNSDGEDIGFPVHDSDELKTITNSEGKQELVGKYIW